MPINKFFNKKVILITGGTGSLGRALFAKLLKFHPQEIRVFSLEENKQAEMKNIYRKYENLKFIIGDIKDKDSINLATKGVDIVYNLAALKHVSSGEENPKETFRTNVSGLSIVAKAAAKNKVKVFVQASSDKAVQPTSVYGKTKNLGEIMINSFNYSFPNAKFVSVRLGNVLESDGSMVPIFRLQIEKFNKVFLTDAEMSRFILTFDQAIKLLLKAASASLKGEVYAYKMPGLKVLDLAKAVIKLYGNNQTKIEYTGKRQGEKLFSLLFDESEHVIQKGEFFVILPHDSSDQKSENLEKDSIKNYTSLNAKQLKEKEILRLISRF